MKNKKIELIVTIISSIVGALLGMKIKGVL